MTTLCLLRCKMLRTKIHNLPVPATNSALVEPGFDGCTPSFARQHPPYIRQSTVVFLQKIDIADLFVPILTVPGLDGRGSEIQVYLPVLESNFMVWIGLVGRVNCAIRLLLVTTPRAAKAVP